MAAGQAFHMLAIARAPAVGERPAAAAEAEAAQRPLAVDGAARPSLGQGREPPAALDAAQWVQASVAALGREPPEARGGARQAQPARGREPLAALGAAQWARPSLGQGHEPPEKRKLASMARELAVSR
jgi:hypothetical protein